jgi:hypothetical protein
VKKNYNDDYLHGNKLHDMRERNIERTILPMIDKTGDTLHTSTTSETINGGNLVSEEQGDERRAR